MKQTRLFFTTIRLPIDYLMLLSAAFLSYFIRFESLKEIRPIIFEIPRKDFIYTILMVALIWLAIFATVGLYSTRHIRVGEELAKVVSGCATGFVLVLIYLVFKQELFSSRFILLSTFIMSIIFVTTSRLIIRGIERISFTLDVGTINLVLIGETKTRDTIETFFKNKPGLGYRSIKKYDHLNAAAIEEINNLSKQNKIDGIIITDPNTPREESLEAVNLTQDLHIKFFYSADLFTTTAANIITHNFDGTPIIEIKRTRLDGWGKIFKRIFDIAGSFLILILTSPITMITALAILIETGLPCFFKNERVGKDGRIFNVLKFRSMYQRHSIGKQFADQEKAIEFEKKLIREQSLKRGPIYKIKDDPRVTRIGHFIRRWSIDELPQLLNVLIGNMSLVGPRPHQPREVAKYSRHHAHVFDIKPGITGLAQISGRSDLDFESEIRLDTYYIEKWSPWLDIYIILRTPFVVIKKKGAY